MEHELVLIELFRFTSTNQSKNILDQDDISEFSISYFVLCCVSVKSLHNKSNIFITICSSSTSLGKSVSILQRRWNNYNRFTNDHTAYELHGEQFK